MRRRHLAWRILDGIAGKYHYQFEHWDADRTSPWDYGRSLLFGLGWWILTILTIIIISMIGLAISLAALCLLLYGACTYPCVSLPVVVTVAICFVLGWIRTRGGAE